MKKIAALFLALGCSIVIFAQDSTVSTLPAVSDTAVNPLPPVKDTAVNPLPPVIQNAVLAAPAQKTSKKNKWANVTLPNRSKDHLMIQLGYLGWSGAPDTINTRGLPRSFNVYFMFDFPFKSNPQFSVGVGAGISSNNMLFSKTYIDIAGQHTNRLSFEDVSDTAHFKKYKLVTTYLEAPVELRYMKDPLHPNKSFKAAVGLKIGTLLSATTKGKTMQSSAGQTILAYTEKVKSKRFFNSSRLSATGRVGLGVISLFATYQVNAFIKEGFGPDIRPYTIGLNISGL
ncbi:MAG: outer membrane beta-barrel protein [Flavitalea sp.]